MSENEEVLNTGGTPAEVDAGVEVDAGKVAEEQAIENLEGHNVEITNNGEKEPEQTAEEKKAEEDKKSDSVEAVEQDIKEQRQAEQDVKKDLEAKGVNYDDLAKEYEENGKLSEESLKALEDAGYPKTLVDAFIKGFEATVESYANAVFKMAGGKEAYGQLCEFIKGLGQADVDAFNETIEHGTLQQLNVMIEGYRARMTTKYGTQNRSILGGGASVSTGGFNSKDAMIKAMNDPRYGTDMAYTEKVQKMTMNATFM